MVLDWPHRNGSKPVTTALNQAIFKAAATVLANELPEETKMFIDALDQCKSKKWRQDYIPFMEQFVRLQSKASPPVLVESCRAALDFATKSFVVRSDDDISPDNNTVISIEQAFSVPSNNSSVLPLPTETLVGTAAMTKENGYQFKLASPHGSDSNPIWISGDDAIAQVNAWTDYGCMESSAADHAKHVLSSQNVSDYVSGKTFCLLGITSEMGPTTHLLKIPGSHVLGIARAGPKFDSLKEWFQSNGPIGTTLQLTAADLLNDMVAIAQWIITTAPTNQPLILMPLAYMDGEANVRVTVAMDAIVSYVIQHRSSSVDVSLVYLTSPTTIYTIPKEAALDAKQRYENQGLSWTNQMISLASFGHWLRPSNSWTQLDGDEFNQKDTIIVYNGAYNLQGPNYCLAKLMQQWRCIVANDDANVLSVHAPHAPGTRTLSVRHNSQAAVAIEGIQYFPPMVTFDVLPCSSLLTAIVLHQLQQGKTRPPHPMELFWDGAVHGGGWRCPYSSESILALTFVLGTAWAKPGWCPLGALAPKPT